MAAVEQKEWPTLGMTLDEACTALRCDRKTLIGMLKNTDFPGRKLGGKAWRIDPDAVKRWMDSKEPAGTSAEDDE